MGQYLDQRRTSIANTNHENMIPQLLLGISAGVSATCPDNSPTKRAATLKSHFVQKPSKLSVHLGFRGGDGGVAREKRERLLHLLISYLLSFSCVSATCWMLRTLHE